MPSDHASGRGEPERILYGRRKGRRLRPRQKRLLDEHLARVRVTLPPQGGRLDTAGLFDRAVGDVWLEVGFGTGEHLSAQAIANPDVGIIGCEPYLTGVARLLAAIESHGLDNVRVFLDDARVLLDSLPERCLGRVFVLFPDPWPKTRHHKRRFVCRPVMWHLSRLMRPGGELRIATDHAGYLEWILEHVRASRGFEWTARTPSDWRNRPPDWPPTRYEAKAIAEGRRCIYLRYRVP